MSLCHFIFSDEISRSLTKEEEIKLIRLINKKTFNGQLLHRLKIDINDEELFLRKQDNGKMIVRGTNSFCIIDIMTGTMTGSMKYDQL